MSYNGDIALGSTIDIKFTTLNAGAPATLSGSPVISAYPDNSVTEITAGITLSADFDSRTGLNNVRVVATSGNGYASGSNYSLVITTGTVGGNSVVGLVVGSFSIDARSALRPTTAGRTLDVTATGEAGIDWANIGGPTTTVNLSGTTVKTATDVEADTQDIQSRLPAALSGDGFIKADMKSIDDELTNGNNATLNLKQLSIVNSAGNAFEAFATGADGIGFYAKGNGYGAGIRGEADTNGDGIKGYGGSGNGSGGNFESPAGDGLTALGGTGGIFSYGLFYGIEAEGGRNGIYAFNDDPNGAAFLAQTAGTNSDGIKAVGSGTGKSINAPQDIAVSDGNLTLAAIASAVWSNVTRTLTSISDSSGVTTLLSRIASVLNISSGKVEANIKQINDTDVTGDGSGTPWGPA